MKRDLELVRLILAEVEAKAINDGQCLRLAIDGYSADDVHYHVQLLAQAGMVEAEVTSTNRGVRAYPKSLTWAGHEFLDAARNDSVWVSAKSEVGKSLLSVPFEVFKSILLKAAAAAAGLG